jgi:hypothetical protein
MFNLFKHKKDAEQKRAEILDALRQASINGRCIILGETPEGTRVIVLGKPLYQRQVEDILKMKGVS